MSTDNQDFSMSQPPLHSSRPQSEDWDRSLNEFDMKPDVNAVVLAIQSTTTPRNSVIFPGEEAEETPKRVGLSKGKRSLSELLRLQKGTDVQLNAEEASRVADVLGQWINSNSAPYEGEDDFFACSQDDLSLLPKRSPSRETNTRPRGQSESMVYPNSQGT